MSRYPWNGHRATDRRMAHGRFISGRLRVGSFIASYTPFFVRANTPTPHQNIDRESPVSLVPIIHWLNASSRFNMHPCLGVDEILRLLARALVASGANTTTVALARCCKTFEEPMLDELWRTQDRLTPLLECFPRDVWEGKGQTFVSPLTTLTWFRVV